MKTFFFLTGLLIAATLAIAEPPPAVRHMEAAADVVAADQQLYLFARYDGNKIVEMILANAAPAAVEPENGHVRVTFRTPAGGKMSFGGNKGLTLVRINPDGRVQQTQKGLPELKDDPLNGFEADAKAGPVDLHGYLAGRADTAPLLEFFTRAEEPAGTRRPAVEPPPATRPDKPTDPAAQLTEGIRRRNVDMVLAALDQKPDLTATGAHGESLVYQAVGMGNADVVTALVKAGADPRTKTDGGDTPLHAAVNANNTAVAKVLLDAGADPNATKGNGWTPLGMAAFRKHLEMVRLLLSAKADPNLKDGRGKTPLDLASMQPKNDEVIKALREAAAGK